MKKSKNLLLFSFFILNPNIAHPLYYPNTDNLELQEKTNLSSKQLTEILNFIKKKENLHVPSWQPGYNTVTNLIKENNLKVGCEIGVAFGTQSLHILQNASIDKLYAIDPYKHFSSEVYDDGMNLNQNYFNVLYYIVRNRLNTFTNKVELIRKTSVEAASDIADFSLDFVYLDANHSYEAVKQDLAAWYNKVKTQGFLIGDDYDHPNFPGVKKAVDGFFSEKNIPVVNPYPGKWYIQK